MFLLAVSCTCSRRLKKVYKVSLKSRHCTPGGKLQVLNVFFEESVPFNHKQGYRIVISVAF